MEDKNSLSKKQNFGDDQAFEAKKREMIKRAAKIKELESKEAAEEDFKRWDAIMRERLLKDIQSHVEKVVSDVRREANKPGLFEEEQAKAMRLHMRPSPLKRITDPEPLEKAIRQDYFDELKALKTGQRAKRTTTAIDAFASIFQQMAREGLAFYGPEMKNYFEFQRRFFEDVKQKE